MGCYANILRYRGAIGCTSHVVAGVELASAAAEAGEARQPKLLQTKLQGRCDNAEPVGHTSPEIDR